MTHKKILLINCHPNADSFNFGLATAYKNGAIQSGAEVKEIIIRDLKFDTNLHYGYQKVLPLEPDLLDAQEKIKWAEHLVWVHPVWWGGLPALAKGFIDRTFIPGFAFKYKKDSVWWDKLLAGRTAHIITTLHQPWWYYWLVFGRPSINQLKKSTLEFCGIKVVQITYVGPIRNSKLDFRKKWLSKIEKLGLQTR